MFLRLLGIPALVVSSAEASAVEDLKWMAGCWTLTSGSTTIEEHWSKPAGGVLLGWSRMLKNGKLGFHEYMRIQVEDGELVYNARENSAGATKFMQTTGVSGEVAFENLKHDYPQRITYRSVSPEEMTAEISGPSGGKTKTQTYAFKRSPCQ